MNNERYLQIAVEQGAEYCFCDVKFYEEEFLATCAAIEKEVEKRVREEFAVICETVPYETADDIAEAIRGGVK